MTGTAHPADGLSDQLRAFVDEAPVARGPHIDFLRRAVSDLRPGARLVDVGAGDAPYRELFDGFDYLTHDWSQTLHAPDVPVDLVSPADALPVDDASVEAIVCTQVLEHVPEPRDVLREFHRVLVPGGRLIMTTPMTWYLHELPHDYYRYTPAGLRHLLTTSGFEVSEILPMNDSAGTLAELLVQLRWILGSADDGRDDRRSAAGEIVAELAPAVRALGWLDTQWLLPVSFSTIAVTPIGDRTTGA